MSNMPTENELIAAMRRTYIKSMNDSNVEGDDVWPNVLQALLAALPDIKYVGAFHDRSTGDENYKQLLAMRK